MNRGVLECWCALSACLVTGIASAQAVDTAAARPGGEADGASFLQEWYGEQIKLRESVWRTYARTAAIDQDSRGRTIADDLNAWVMTKDVQDRLSSMREAAQRQLRAGDEQGARQTLDSGRPVVQEQRRVLSMLNYYWEQRIALNRLRDLWLTWLTLSADGVAAQSKQRMDPLETALIHNFSPTTTQAEMTKRVASLRRAYDEERIKLAALVSDQRVAEGKPVAARERRTACPASPPQPTGHERNGSKAAGNQPVTIAMDMSPGRFYPEAARRNGVSGTVDLRLTIGPTGCMERAEVLRSTGAEELDQAAIDLTEYVHYLPAKHGDQPVRATYMRSITFQSESGTADLGPDALPTTAGGYITRGNNRLDNREYDLAIADFDKAIEINPTAAMAFADRGMANIWKRNLELARKDLDAANALDPRNPVVFRGRGVLALYADDVAAALEAFAISLEMEPHNIFALQYRADAYVRAGEPDKALADHAEAIQFRPSSLFSYSRRAAIFRSQGRLDLSAKEVEALLAANAGNARANVTAGAIDAASGKDVEAMRAFDRAVEISPDESTHLTRAAYRHRTDPAGERSDIDAALKLNPHSIQASIRIAKMQSAAGDYAGALDTLGNAMASKTDNYDLLTERGIVYAKSGQAALAERDFAAARKFATSAEALNNICWAKATAGVALDTARAECDASVAEASYDSAAQDSRGFVLLRLGRNSEAVASYDIALKIRPLSAESLYGRGLAKRRQGKLDEANTDIRAALLGDAHVAETFAEFGLAQ